ncbi:MAG: hypothetical protein EOP48_09320 [Sphingobacteriales bacterium]|nr:MAG: hypothetical protein EOP48_09320 [Sphingobacteriales bacterium]
MRHFTLVLFILTNSFFANSQKLTDEELAQLYSSEQLAFISTQQSSEDRFIHFLKVGNLDSCMILISEKDVQAKEKLEIRKHLTKLIGYIKNGTELVNKWKLCNPSPMPGSHLAVGCFGHNVKGTIEKNSRYHFIDKNGKELGQLALYYWNSDNFGLIRHIYYLDAAEMIQEF